MGNNIAIIFYSWYTLIVGDKYFFKIIGTAGDIRLRFKISTKQWKVIEFLVQLEVNIAGKWKPVVRYDNAHDFPHRDVLNIAGECIEKMPLKLGTLDEILEYAEQDLLDRVDWYIERFFKRKGS